MSIMRRPNCIDCEHCTATSLLGRKALICTFRPLLKEVQEHGDCIYFAEHLGELKIYVTPCVICERRADHKEADGKASE